MKELPRSILSSLAVTLSLLLAGPLAASPWIRGRVVDTEGKPLAKASIELYPSLEPRLQAELILEGRAYPDAAARSVSKADGGFELEAPSIGMWQVVARARGYLPMQLSITPLLEDIDLATARLARARKASLRLADTGGRPLVGSVLAMGFARQDGVRGRISRSFLGGWTPALRLAVADEEGRAAFPSDSEETLQILAHAAGYAPVAKELEDIDGETLTFRAGTPVTLRILDSRRRPLPDVIALRGEPRAQLPFARADREGRIPTQAPEKAGALFFLGPDGQMGTLQALEVPKPKAEGEVPEVEVVMSEPRTVTGRVIESVHRAPVADALVWLYGMESRFARTDRQGVYQLRSGVLGLAESLPVRLPISAVAEGYALGGDMGSKAGAEGQGPTIVLEPAARVSGKVVDSSGKGVAGVEIRAVPMAISNRGRYALARMLQGQNLSRTSSTGRFEISRLAAGAGYSLELRKPGYARTDFEVATLEPHEHREGLEIVLGTGSSALGRVVDEGDRPIAGAEVRLAPPAAEGQRRIYRMMLQRDEAEELSASSGSDGLYTLRDLNPGRYDLRVRAGGYAGVTVPGVEVASGPEPTDLGTVALGPGVRIEGRVSDAEGLPLAGAKVSAQETFYSTGADGYFAVPDLKPGSQISIQVDKEGYSSRLLRGVSAPTQEPLVIVLEPVATVSGQVLGPSKEPIAGAQVMLRAERKGGSGSRGGLGGWSAGVSDAEGRFVIADAEPGRLGLSVQAEGFIPYQRTGLVVEPGGELTGLEITLEAGATVEGTVRGPDGEPQSGIFVHLSDPAGARHLTSGGSVTDGDGRYRIDGVETGPAAISARHESLQNVIEEVEIEPGTNVVDLTFESGRTVSGRAVDASGRPVSGAMVRLRGTGRQSGFLQAGSDAAGEFVVEGVADGVYTLVAEHPEFAQAELEGLEVSGADLAGLEVRFETGGAIHGRVLGLAFDDLAELMVSAMGSGGRGRGEVDFEGRYRIDNLAPGKYFVQARQPGGGRQVQETVTLEPGVREIELDLDFSQGYTLSGRVLHGSTPLVGANLQASGLSNTGRGGAVSDQTGRFRIENLGAGRYRIVLNDYATGLNHSEEVEITGDREIEIVLETAAVSGRLRDASDFGPVSGARLELKPEGDSQARRPTSFYRDTRSDSEGRFHLGEVSEGSWLVVATKGGYAPAEARIEVRGGAPIDDLELSMTPTQGITFEAFGADGRPLVTLRAAFLDAGGGLVSSGRYEGTREGRFRISTLPPGSFEMLLVDQQHAVLALQIASPGDLGRLQLAPGGTLTIQVPELAGAAVEAAAVLKSGPRTFHVPGWNSSVRREWPLASGRGQITSLPAGTWQVTVHANDGRTWTGSAQVVPGGEAGLTLR